MPVLDFLKGSTGKIWAIGILVAIFLLYLVTTSIIDKLNEDANSHNVSVAAKATSALKQSIEDNNKKAEEIDKLKQDMVDKQILEQKVDELVKKNNELVSKPTEKIKKIDNTKILYIEEPPDIEKSKIIIRGIHEAYNKETGEKK